MIYILIYEKERHSTPSVLRFSRLSYAEARARDMLVEGQFPLAIKEVIYEAGDGMEAVA
jgi:hypothetical protein